MTFSDTTDLVDECASSRITATTDRVVVTAMNVVAQWNGSMCADNRRANLDRVAGVLVLTITEIYAPRPSSAPSCAGGVFPVTLSLSVSEGIDAPLRATFQGNEVPVTQSRPLPSSSATQMPTRPPEPPAVRPSRSQTSSVEPPEAAGVTDTESTGMFTLTFTSPRSVWATDEAITAEARLSVAEADGPITLSGSGSGLVVFGVEQLDGTRKMSGAWLADCRSGGYSLSPDEPTQVAFAKGGAYDPNGPDAKFWNDYFHDPKLQLPPGHWRITASALFSIGDTCTANPTSLRTSIDIVVKK